MEDFTPDEIRETIGFTAKLDQSFGKCAVVKHFDSLGIQGKSVGRTLAKLECGEKLEGTRKWKKSCQAPCFCQEEDPSTIMWPCWGCLWDSWHQSSKWSRVAWTGWSPSLMKYMENIKSCSCQTLQVLIPHFQLEPCSMSSSCCMHHKKQNPPHMSPNPKLHPS